MRRNNTINKLLWTRRRTEADDGQALLSAQHGKVSSSLDSHPFLHHFSPATASIDLSLFPRITALILSFSTREALLVLRSVSRTLKTAANVALERHVRFSLNDSESLVVETPHGRIPRFAAHRGTIFKPSAPPLQRSLSVRALRRSRSALGASALLPTPSLTMFAHARVVDISTANPPTLVFDMLAHSSVQMIRFTPAVELPYYSRPIPSLKGLTIVHFWMEKTCLLPPIPASLQERVTKVVFTIRHFCPVAERLKWCETYNSRYESVTSVVFIFPCPGGPTWITDPNYFHQEHFAGEVKRRPSMFYAFVEQVARILLCTRSTVSFVALRDIPHPRFLGVVVPELLDETVGVELEDHFVDEVEKELKRTAANFGVDLSATEALDRYLARLKMLSIDSYWMSVGREEFDLEVHA